MAPIEFFHLDNIPVLIFFGTAIGTALGLFAATVRWSYRDPLFKYVSKDSTVITKKAWLNVEKNIAIEIHKATVGGTEVGREQIITAFEDGINGRKGIRRTPYKILGLKAGQESKLEEITAQLLNMYEPSNFEYLDAEFVELAQARIKEIEVAAEKIRQIRLVALGGMTV